MSFHRTLTMSAMLVLAAGTAFAHPGHPGGEPAALGFAGGFVHPLGGLDHLLAMVAVGLWAIQHGGRRALWLLPLSFVLPMAGGFALALAGIGLPGVEAGIALSVLVLGLLVAFAVRPPLPAAMAVTAAFALLHGHAHGSEMGDASHALLYAGGMVLATALLHAGGLVAARLAQQVALPMLTRAAGAAVAVAGIVILVG
ncbi:HupE/UreJ family protein [Ferrovibrio sp.]|jgi:urease accessory protein|uniref:HupE/UreJ family protein n=1 Tax=Ferrovibrio sp. TaxID=1917215 RepID=UPI0035B1D6A4